MPGKKVFEKIPERSLTLLFLCLSVIAFILLAVILPRQNGLRAVEEEIISLKEEIEVQNSLAPVYGTLKKISAREQSTDLPYPRKGKLHWDRIALLPVMMSEVGADAGMQTIQVSPELTNLNGSADSLSVNLIIRGDLKNFRNYLLALGSLSFLERIEEIKIEMTVDGLEYRVRANIAIG